MRYLTVPLLIALVMLASGCTPGRWVATEIEKTERCETYLEQRLEDGAVVTQGFDHPAAVDPGKLSDLLGALCYLDPKFLGGNDEAALFSQAGAKRLARQLSRGLAEAGPDQRVLFVSLNRAGHLLPSWRRTRGVVFMEKDRQLNIAFSCINQDRYPDDLDIMARDRFAIDPVKITFTGTPLVKLPWLSIKRQETKDQPHPLWAVADLKSIPSGTPAPTEESTTTDTDGEETQSRKIKSKLKLLQELKEDGLITEEDYEKMKGKLLDTL